MSDSTSFLLFVLIVILFIAIVFGSVGGAVYAVSSYSCSQIEENSGHETKYVLLSGCYIQIDEQWIPVNRWRVLED